MRPTGGMAKKGLWAVALATVVLLAGAGTASAVDRLVTTSGTDTGDCSVSACATIAYATTQALSGDTVSIGAGTFVQTAAIAPGNKSVSYVGQGPGLTVVSANDANNFALAGMFRFQYTGTSTTISDLTISHMPKVTSASAGRYGIYIQPQLPAPANQTYTINATIDNVQFVGNTGTPLNSENAVYVAANAGTIDITNCDLDDVMGNSILLEQQIGPATVSGNTIDKPLSSTGPVIYNMTHANPTNTIAWDVAGKYTVTNNTINAAAGVYVLAGWPFTAQFGPSAFDGGVEISNNTINTSSSTATAIGLLNATANNDGSAGEIVGVTITGNSLSGSGPGNGIALQGGIPDPQISGNNIRNRDNGILLRRFTQTLSPGTTFDHHPTGTVASANQIVGNESGVTTDPGIPVTATLDGNWWGCNAGPDVEAMPASTLGCDTVTTFDSSTITLEKWVVLGITGSPPTLAADGTSTVTAGFTSDNLGGAAPQVFADGTILPMGATGGTLTVPNPTLTSSEAINTFTSTGPVDRTASATMDNQTVTFVWPDLTAPPPVITISSPSNGAVVAGSSVTLSYSVSSPATCSPPSGTSVPLNVGANTIFVTCTDAFGNVATASVVVVRPDALPECAKDVIITSVSPSGSQTRISGYARLKFAGQRLRLQYQPSGSRTIARPVVQSDGSWRAVVHRPSRPKYTSNNARYRATLGGTSTAWIKLTRRMGAVAISSIGGQQLSVRGNTSLPIVKGQPLRVERSDACGNYRQVGWLKVFGSGTFGGNISDGGSSDTAVFVRVKLRVRSSASRNTFNTYSIIQPVIIKR